MTQGEAIAWIADLLEEPVESLSPDSPLDAFPNWDSLGVLTLIAGLSEKFDITIETDDVMGLATLGDILDVLRRHGKLTD